MTKSYSRLLSFALFAVSLTLTLSALAPLHALHAADHSVSRPLQITGVPNAGKVNDFLCRGGQPSDDGLRKLERLGITTIVDLRGKSPAAIEKEHQHLQSLGLDH